MIPDSTNPKAYDHYAYVNNNPLIYTDPDGNIAILVTMLVGAVVGAVVDSVIQVIDNKSSGMDFKEAVSNIDLAEVAVSAVAGGVAGLTMGVGTAVLSTASLGLSTTAISTISGGFGTAIGGQAGALAEAGIKQIDEQNFDNDEFWGDAKQAGFGSVSKIIFDSAMGCAFGFGSARYFPSPSAQSKFSVRYNNIPMIGFQAGKMITYNGAKYSGLELAFGDIVKSSSQGALVKISEKLYDITSEIISQTVDRYWLSNREMIN